MKPTETNSALPPDAVAELRNACAYPAGARADAIDAATLRIMSRYPWAYSSKAIREAAEREAGRAANCEITGLAPR